MGEYTGRRRGRPASEPQPEEPVYGEEAYGYGSYEQGYQEPQPSYEHGYEAPSYETYDAYGYQEQQYAEPEPFAPELYAPELYAAEPQQPHSRRGQPSPEEAYAPEYGYAEQSTEQYAEQYYEGYADEQYVEEYAEPRFETRRRSSATAEEYDSGYYTPEYAEHGEYTEYTEYNEYTEYAEDDQYAEDYPQQYAPEYTDQYPPAPAPRPRARQALPLLAHLPFLGASTAALAIASFVSAKAVAGVVLPLQLLVAWAILDLAGHASRRTAVLIALPTLAATVGTFKFQADESATAIAGGLGAGFFLLAADAVFRAGRRGVEPGTVQAVGAAAAALLFAGLTGLFLPAARLHPSAVAIGAAVGALLGLVAARNPELGSSRVVVVALPATGAALASYAAAILVA